MTPTEREEWTHRILVRHEKIIDSLEEKVADLEAVTENLSTIIQNAGIKVENPSVFPLLKKIRDKEDGLKDKWEED